MLKLKEAIARSEMNGKKIMKKEIAARLWATSNKQTRQVNMTNLLNGRTKKINFEWVIIICTMLDCTADYLFGLQKD